MQARKALEQGLSLATRMGGKMMSELRKANGKWRGQARRETKHKKVLGTKT